MEFTKELGLVSLFSFALTSDSFIGEGSLWLYLHKLTVERNENKRDQFKLLRGILNKKLLVDHSKIHTM